MVSEEAQVDESEIAQRKLADGQSRTRRGILKAFGVAAAGAVAGAALSPKEALAHGSLHVDSNNDEPAIHGNNTDVGPGLEGTAVSGPGVHAVSSTGVGASGAGVVGVSGEGSTTGVAGTSPTGKGMLAAGGLVGIDARSDEGTAVWAQTSLGTGLLAIASSRFTGIALDIRGRCKFASAGEGLIAPGEDSAFVGSFFVTNQSHITVTLTGGPGMVATGFPIMVHWVERQANNGFRVHLTRKAVREIPFTYLIVEPGE